MASKVEQGRARVKCRLSVQIPSGARIFPSSHWVPSAISFHIYIILTFAHLGAWLAASLICLKMTV